MREIPTETNSLYNSYHPPTHPIIHPSMQIYISQEELRAGFARYEFSALRLAFGLAGE